MAQSGFSLNVFERSKSKSLRFQSLICHKGAGLGHILILNINRKPYMESSMAPSDLTLQGQSHGHLPSSDPPRPKSWSLTV